MPETQSFIIRDVVLSSLFRDFARLRLSISTGKGENYQEEKVNAEAADPDSKTVWSPALSLDGLEASAIVEFRLCSPRRLVLFPRCLLGRVQIPITDMIERVQNKDFLHLLGRSTLPTVWLQISLSADYEEIAGRLVKGASQPKDFMEKVSPIIDWVVPVKRMIDIVAESHSAAKLAWSIVSVGVEILHKQKHTNELVAKLYRTMKTIYEQASQDNVLRNMKKLAPVYKALFNQTISCARFIEERAGQSILGRVVHLNLSEKAQKILDKFEELKGELHQRVASETLERDEINRTIETLKVAFSQYNTLPPGSKCMKGTRVQSIGHIEKWIDSRNGGTFWCRGMAGTGKSSLMATLHERLTNRASGDLGSEETISGDARTGAAAKGTLLAAFLRCDGNSATNNLIPAIAYSLCSINPDIGAAIARVIKDTPTVAKLSPKGQFEMLLRQPLTSIQGLEDVDSFLIIVDGLDECHPSKELLEVLAGFRELPFVRLIVSSRSTASITDAFNLVIPPSAQLDLGPSSDDADRDIRFYISSRFNDIYAELKLISSASPDDFEEFRNQCEALDAVEKFTNQAKGFFIWAVTICNILSRVPSVHKLRNLLDTPNAALDPMMTTIYRNALDDISLENGDDIELKEYIHDVLATIVAVGRPIHVRSFNTLVARRPGGLAPSYVLRMLGSVVQISGEDIIQPVHVTFFDFLRDKERSGDWYIDVVQERAALINRFEAALKDPGTGIGQ